MRSCCSLIASVSAAAPRETAVRSASTAAPAPFASASAAVPRLRPFHLLLLPDCVCFDCCSPPAVLEDSSPCSMFSSQSSTLLNYEGRTRHQSSPAPRTSHFRYTQTDKRLLHTQHTYKVCCLLLCQQSDKPLYL